jgi:hypothetical protein
MVMNRYAASTLPHDCDTVGISTKLFYVVVDPPQYCHLIFHSIVTRRFIITSAQKTWNIRELYYVKEDSIWT